MRESERLIERERRGRREKREREKAKKGERRARGWGVGQSNRETDTLPSTHTYRKIHISPTRLISIGVCKMQNNTTSGLKHFP